MAQAKFQGTAPVPAVTAVAAPFFLSEGDRLELELHGFTNINGRRMAIAEVRAELAKSETQKSVVIAGPAAGE